MTSGMALPVLRNQSCLYDKDSSTERGYAFQYEVIPCDHSPDSALSIMATSPVFKQPHLYPPQLPAEFPQGLAMQFNLGDRVQWIPLPSTDWGTIIGLEYEWSEFLKSWKPMYCVLLDANSPSYQWIDREWAWEWDLQPVAAEAARM